MLRDIIYLNQGEKTLNAIVSNNDIYLDDTDWGGIWGYGAQDVLILNNKISGTGFAGIYTGWDEWETANNWTLLGNNVQNVDALVAPIWLGPGTSNCTVVGGNTKEIVRDDGTDNIVVGMNHKQGTPLGPEIQDAMQQKKDLIDSFRRHP